MKFGLVYRVHLYKLTKNEQPLSVRKVQVHIKERAGSAPRWLYMLYLLMLPSAGLKQELSYRKQIARQLHKH